MLRPACGGAPNANADLHWFAENLPDTPHPAVGIALTSDGMPGSFAAFGLAPHDSSNGRYFSSVPFNDPKMLNSSTAVFAGVPVGSSPLLPRGTYTPVLALANFSQAPRHVTVRYALTQSGAPSLKTVTTVTLAPLSSREIALRGLTGDPMLQDSFVVVSDGSPGDVEAKLVSRSKDSRLHEVELLGKDLDDTANGGDHPWTIASGTTSTLLLFNESSKPQWFNVRIAAGVLVWSKAYQLQPKQTIAIKINDLSRTRARDDNGKAFPSDVWWGQVGWSAPQKDAGRGRLLQSDPEAAMARSFSCNWILMICGAYFDSTPSSVPAGQISNFGQVDDIQTCMNTCSGNPAGGAEQDGYYYVWSSEDTSVASIAAYDYPWDPNIYGVGAGSTFIDGWVSDDYCTVGVGAIAAVTPTITSISPSTIPIGGPGVQVTISGFGFGTSPIVNASGVQSSNQQSTDSQITVTLTAGYSQRGLVDLTVSANGQQSAPELILLNGPDHAVVQSDIPANEFPSGMPIRLVTYIVYNQDGTVATGIPIAESYTVSGWSCKTGPNGGQQPTPPLSTTVCNGLTSTDASTGSFSDKWGLDTAYGPAGCGFNITDHWQWCSPSGSGPNPGITFMTLTGFIHTNATQINTYTLPPSGAPAGTTYYP